MILTLILAIIIAFGIFICSILFHELGHLLYFNKVLKKKVKVNFERAGLFGNLVIGTEEDYKDLTTKQYTDLLQIGIVFGFIPILLGMLINLWYGAIIVPYLMGCKSDLKNLELHKPIEEDDCKDEL
jgi:hypothetical protein